jgi:hypothetical protein
MSDPRERAFAILARVASSRETMYRWLALGFYAPDDQFAEALISQRLVYGVVAAIEWLGKDQQLFDEGLQRLQRCRAVTPIERPITAPVGMGPDRCRRAKPLIAGATPLIC